MNISAGISAINHYTRIDKVIEPKKTYLWPVYNAGSVDKIQNISRKTQPGQSYSKPLSFDNKSQLSTINKQFHTEYTSYGRAHNNPSNYYPGQYFNALA